MNLGISGKNVLVVGASKGIGKSIAIGFAEEGARVTTIARSEELLIELEAEMKQAVDIDHAYYVSDIMESDANQLARRLIEDRGIFDIVVHNVGGSLVSRNALGTLDEWKHAWKFNAGVAIDMNNVLIQPMINKGWGRVIHISSISAEMLRGNPLYASAKAFLNAYVTTVGRTIAPTGVVMSAVMPGAVAFPGSYWDKFTVEDPARCEDFLSHHQAANRFGTTKEIADVVLFMASEQASFMQAALVPVDGANM
ncbi:SDR family oxidoreductase [Neobacillus sp. PS3-34]|uniref:SDR family NAD(P)-dependent oxidoreductase n=1 Tax=Neobacillus sp. PS3-34 TaxID=3070678 RepID=UPI0027E081EF|nr:SDR family oxidoreductase [Neobacillus sp. PS3-34]WML46673.1 SDR family oxidoreductase [Neobacillus sp. PS3-34]